MKTPVLLLMGVSGSGKSTVGALLAGRLHWPYADADSFHPAANVEKMAAGHPLTDEDRIPWLRSIRAWIDERVTKGEPALVSCSALKRAYRDMLRTPEVIIVYLLLPRQRRRLLVGQGVLRDERRRDDQDLVDDGDDSLRRGNRSDPRLESAYLMRTTTQ
jgi:gluconokinase